MRKFTFKSLLITAALCLSSSAWAAETKTSVYNNNFETSSDFTRTGKTNGHEYTPGVSAANTFGSQILGGGQAEGDKGFMSPQFSVNEADIVDIDFKFKMDACTGGKSSGIYITTGKNTQGWLSGVSSVFSIKASANGNGYWGTITVGGEDLTSLLNTTGTYECNVLNRNTTGVIQLNLRLNFLLQKATYSLTRADGTVLVDNKTVEFESEASTIYGLFFSAGKSYGGVYIDDLNVYTVESDEVIATKDYIINYQYEGNTIHSTTGNLAVGASVESETAITVDEVKYLSVNDAQKFEITADGTNTWDVEVRKAYTATVSLVTTIAGAESEPVTITFTETDDKQCIWSYGYPLYIKSGDVYYIADNTETFGEVGTFTNGQVIEKSVSYTNVAEDVVFFAESQSETMGSNPAYSNGAKGNVASQNKRDRGIYVGTLPIGTYEFIVNIAAANRRSVVARVGAADPFAAVGTSDSDKTTGIKSATFTLTEETSNIFINGANSGTEKTNQSEEFDYVIIKRTGDATVSTTITAAGYATFSSAYAVDFSAAEGLTAYTAKVNDNKQTITLTKIADGIVPANTGIVLKGAAGEYTGTITTTEATVDNDLIANNAEITSDGNIYVLNNGTNGIGFYPLTEGKTLAAGKAYLQLASGAKGYSFVWNDGETTGIEENYEFGTMNSDAATFDLSGRKVANPAKGLYIKNGKKFIVK